MPVPPAKFVSTEMVPEFGVLENEENIDYDNEEEQLVNFVETFGPPLYMVPPSQDAYISLISQYQHIMPMRAFENYNNLSDRGFPHLIQLMGHHIPAENLMETNVEEHK